MSRRMMFVVAISALAGLCVAFMLGNETGSPRPPGAVAFPADGIRENAASDMEKALRKAIEGSGTR